MLQPSEWSLVICGGGSGGHLFPALAVVEELQQRPLAPQRILFLTGQRSIDRAILDQHGAEQIALPAVDSPSFRRHPVQSLKSLWRATAHASKVLKSLPSPVLLGTGGYGSVPGVLAGRWRKRPIFLMEQNVIPGRATSFLARFARTVCLSFSETRQFLPENIKTEFTGNPVRAAIAQMSPKSAASRKRILVLGGSQGATAVNAAMLRFAAEHSELLKGWTILHQTGHSDCERIRKAYKEMKQKAEVSAFFENMPETYQKAGIIVTRAGGTSLAEIACAGLPAVIVPYPRSLRNHQQINARHFVGRKAAYMIEQGTSRFDSDFATAIHTLIEDKLQRKIMGQAMRNVAEPEAAQRVADLIQATVKQTVFR
ncbi:undecaprenyldiphospho-muramoylpentapeptide beta-N-acetylglucosaminyltransferase [Planctomicrobium sp. SH661]|uniref:undecaprenyldiphospho-muramoylpentapeptide beta-N-acetylglucosaminyltransferase n=1 Tax=Planctomicrobium sp. SH661 TaxID=3448124 RepID=UPI003F5B4870